MWMIPTTSIQDPELLKYVRSPKETQRKADKLDQAVQGSWEEKYQLLYEEHIRVVEELGEHKAKTLMLEAAEKEVDKLRSMSEKLEGERESLKESLHERDLNLQRIQAELERARKEAESRERQLLLEKELETHRALNLSWRQRRKAKKGEARIDELPD